MMCWSPEQVTACRTRDIIKEFEGKHLPWCVFTTPFESSSCNCHNANRIQYLEHYAQHLIDEQDWKLVSQEVNKKEVYAK